MLAYILCSENGSGDPEELQECGGGGDGQAQHQHQESTTANSTFNGTSTREHQYNSTIIEPVLL